MSPRGQTSDRCEPRASARRSLGAISLVGVLVALVASFIPVAAHAERRVALVIGNSTYRHTAALANPVNDAQDMAAALERVGFTVVLERDLDRHGMEDAIARFARLAQDADVALFFYAGHGMQYRGSNYLMPVDARLDDEFKLTFELNRVDDVLFGLERARGVKILILDACRDNPLADRLTRVAKSRDFTPTHGLAKIEASRGMVIAYSTQADQVAIDGKGRNSPFTAALVEELAKPGIEIGTLFRRVAADVNAATDGRQLPELSLSLIGDFFLNNHDTDLQAWTKLEGSTDQRKLQEFIDQYPQSPLTRDVRRRLAALDGAEKRQTERAQNTEQRTEQKSGQVAAAALPVVPAAPAPCGPNTPVTASLSPRPGCPLSVAEEHALKPKDSFRECNKCPLMTVVPAGGFLMGSPRSEEGHTGDEEPQHLVTIARQFAVGRFAVTFEEWDACVADGGCNGYRPWDNGWGRGRQPVVNASWTDAKAYVGWLSRKTGRTYRLLSEAEREYVARAGTTTAFWWGSSISPNQANYSVDAAAATKAAQQPRPVGAYEANSWDLYDVHGNVWEWVEDCVNRNYKGAPANGSAWVTGACTQHVLRGGSWVSAAALLRSAARYGVNGDARVSNVGFRVARTIGP